MADVSTLPSRIFCSYLSHCFVGNGVVEGERRCCDSQVGGKRSDGEQTRIFVFTDYRHRYEAALGITVLLPRHTSGRVGGDRFDRIALFSRYFLLNFST